MIKFHHQSIVRNGNHFIKLGDDYPLRLRDRWFLIDGPWFEYLERFNTDFVHLPPYRLMSRVPLDDEGCPYIEGEYTPPTLWERNLVRLTSIGHRFYRSHLHYDRMADKYDHVVYHPMKNILVKHSYIYGWECNRGILPAYIKNPEWDDALEELFTYTVPYNRLEGA